MYNLSQPQDPLLRRRTANIFVACQMFVGSISNLQVQGIGPPFLMASPTCDLTLASAYRW